MSEYRRLSTGSHTLTATARDAAGNQTTSASVTDREQRHHTTGPLERRHPSITATGATLTWTSDEAGDSQVEFGPTPVRQRDRADMTLVTVHTISRPG
jgi:hypothetical protein